jgi:hypothetical protein
MKTRRLVMASILACLPIAAAVTPAAAIPPARGCPPAFVGPLGFEELILAFPPPPEIPHDDVIAILDSFDKNNDDQLCVRAGPHPPEINIIDNIANNPSGS